MALFKMKRELEQKLREEFPTVFRDLWGNPMQTCMAWGIECNDGWYNLIRDICLVIEPKGVVAFQIKEKFGTLRFYHDSTDESVLETIAKVEQQSEKVCEICGNPGYLCGTTWLKTRCDKCIE